MNARQHQPHLPPSSAMAAYTTQLFPTLSPPATSTPPTFTARNGNITNGTTTASPPALWCTTKRRTGDNVTPGKETSKRSVGADRKVFISYAQDGFAFAREIEEELASNGFTVFTKQDLRSGEFWAERLRNMTAESDTFIVLITPECLGDYFVFSELTQAAEAQARDCHKRIIPILLDRNAQVPAMLSMYRALDLSDPSPRKHGIRLLVDAIKESSPKNLLEWDDLFAAQSQNISHDVPVREMEAYSSVRDSQVARARQKFQRGVSVAILSAPGSILIVLLFSDVNSNWRVMASLGALVAINILMGLVLQVSKRLRDF